MPAMALNVPDTPDFGVPSYVPIKMQFIPEFRFTPRHLPRGFGPPTEIDTACAIVYNGLEKGAIMRVCYRIWVDNKGKAFGEGPYRLLQGVVETGSLHQAAARLRMSYRKAWTMLNNIEERLGFPLLERKVGGASGGGSTVTSAGTELMRHYEAFRKEAEQKIKQAFEKHLGYIDSGNQPQ